MKTEIALSLERIFKEYYIVLYENAERVSSYRVKDLFTYVDEDYVFDHEDLGVDSIVTLETNYIHHIQSDQSGLDEGMEIVSLAFINPSRPMEDMFLNEIRVLNKIELHDYKPFFKELWND